LDPSSWLCHVDYLDCAQQQGVLTASMTSRLYTKTFWDALLDYGRATQPKASSAARQRPQQANTIWANFDRIWL